MKDKRSMSLGTFSSCSVLERLTSLTRGVETECAVSVCYINLFVSVFNQVCIW